VRRAIPLSTPGPLLGAARRTWAARIVLALALVGALAWAFLAAGKSERADALLHGGGSPVVAVDLSWSVTSRRDELIGEALGELVRTGRELGLVLFSDTAYEALPVGTRAEAVRPFLRFFDGKAATNPWTGTFSAGTQIGQALVVARTMLRDAGVEDGSVTLISDLNNAPQDQPLLAEMLVTYQREGIPIRAIGLNAAPEDVRYFTEALRPGHGTVQAFKGAAPTEVRRAGSREFPVALVVAAGLVALLLALNEHVLGALAWGRRRVA
jgi:hypothetical protein